MDCLSSMLIKVEVEGQIKGFEMGRGQHKLSITYLQFVDGTLLFSSPSLDHFNKLFPTTYSFKVASSYFKLQQVSMFVGLGLNYL